MVNDSARVIFADARQLDKILPEKSVDLVLAGPPYWNEVVYSNDNAQLSRIDDYNQFLLEISKCWQGCSFAMRDGSVLAIWVHDLLRKIGNGYRYIPLHSDIIGTFPKELVLKNVYIWDRYLNKNRGDIHTDQFGTRVQYILIFQKKGLSHNKDKIDKALQSIYWQPVWHKKTIPKLFGSKMLFRVGSSLAELLKVLNIGDRMKMAGVLKDDYIFSNYMTECPLDVADHLINLFSSPGDTVLDPFVGSGTTLKSALSLGRKGVGIEINKNSIAALKNKLGNKATFL